MGIALNTSFGEFELVPEPIAEWKPSRFFYLIRTQFEDDDDTVLTRGWIKNKIGVYKDMFSDASDGGALYGLVDIPTGIRIGHFLEGKAAFLAGNIAADVVASADNLDGLEAWLAMTDTIFAAWNKAGFFQLSPSMGDIRTPWHYIPHIVGTNDA